MLPLPSIEDLASILHKCRKERNLALALRLHASMCEHGLDTHTLLGNHLVSSLVEFGSMCHAQQVFDKLVYQDEQLWNCLIVGYVKEGESQHALTLYRKMHEDDSLHPNGHTFVSLLKACIMLKDLEGGCEIHAEIARKGLLERDVFVGSTLVDMYAKCGSLQKAQEVFDNLPVRNIVTWAALIAGYAEHGGGEEALHCLEQMHHEGISLDAVTFVYSLKACAHLGAVDKGHKLHAEIVGTGLERNLFVGSTLVDMYAKCDCLAEAQEVFEKLPNRNVVSWNALIARHAEHGCGEEALNCFKWMKHEGVYPGAVTFVCILKACGSIGATDKGREIHAEIVRIGLLEGDVFVGSTLVDMYAKCDSIVEAQDVFDKLPVRNIVTWTTLMAGYVEHGHGQEALNCFKQMQHEGISSDAVTLVCSLNACGNLGITFKGREIHVEIVRKGLETEALVGNTLVDMYAKCGLLAEAQKVFDKLPVRTIVSWTALVAGYTEHGCGEEAFNCFVQMQQEGNYMDAVTFVCSLKACGIIGARDKGREIHAEIIKTGLLERDLVLGSTLVDMYTKCGCVAEAQEVFDKLCVRDVVSWTARIVGYAEHGLGEEALNCLDQMQQGGIFPNDVSLGCCLKACGSIGVTVKGREIHAEIVTKGLERELLIGSTLVDMYAKCGLIAEAQEVFDKLPVRNVVLWTALISGYAQLGGSENIFLIFDKMIEEGIKPDPVTLVSVLNACTNAGLVHEGQMYFEAISNDYGLVPTLEHYTCMVDLFGRAGHIDKAVAMIKKMPFQPGIVMWHTVLGACQKWGNVELGRHAFEQALGLDEKDHVAFICMSNIFANVDT